MDLHSRGSPFGHPAVGGLQLDFQWAGGGGVALAAPRLWGGYGVPPFPRQKSLPERSLVPGCFFVNLVAIFFWKCALWEFLHGVAAWFASDLKEKNKRRRICGS